MSGVAVALSFVLVQVDAWLGVDVVRNFNLLYTFGPEGARAILSVIASSMITVASLSFPKISSGLDSYRKTESSHY